MTFPEFVRAVQSRAGVISPKEALMVTDATLSVLGGRLYKEPGEKIGADLEPQIRQYLQVQYLGREFGLEEFYRLVCVAAGIDLPTAKARCAVVLSVLRDAMAPGELEDIRARLPVEFRPLFSWYEGMPLAA